MHGAASNRSLNVLHGEPVPLVRAQRRVIRTEALIEAAEVVVREEDAVEEDVAGEEMLLDRQGKRTRKWRGRIRRRIKERGRTIIDEMQGLGRWLAEGLLGERVYTQRIVPVRKEWMSYEEGTWHMNNEKQGSGAYTIQT